VGLLRTILALLVVGSHLGAFGGATFAVKGFFIISGFYMALVISTRYYALPVAIFTRRDCYDWFPFIGSSGC
jgi:peptidoglycan/LPS O-acetylase OafA/YrhL